MLGKLIDVGIDFETYYDSEYTLRKLTTAQYILDARFEAIGFSLLLGGALPVWFSGDRDYLARVLARIPWERVRCIAHNAIFDGSILEWQFGIQPAEYFCTMMGSRPYVAPYTGRMDLSSTLAHLQLGEKGDFVHRAQGKHRTDFSVDDLAAYGRYCCDDSVGSRRIFDHVTALMPEDERYLLDLTIKKFTRPLLRLDQNAIETRLAAIAAKKVTMLSGLESRGITRTMINSRPKFAALLTSKGVTLPMKTSPTTGQPTFAFAKMDTEFIALQEHDDPEVRELVNARIFVASNMEEKRLQRLLDIALMTVDAMLPVPLLYYGAHPGRFSGLDSINLQNLPRKKMLPGTKTPDPESGWLRQSIVAPAGYTILAGDLANIEARIVATLAQCWELVDAFARGIDVYSDFASSQYGRKITKADVIERFVGKTCILGLGYGMGWAKLWKQLTLAKVIVPEKFAKDAVYGYRRKYKEIEELWKLLEAKLLACIDPRHMSTYGPVTFLHERIMLPNGMPIIYPGLKVSRNQSGNTGLAFQGRHGKTSFDQHLWGGAITENIVQALARIILTRAEIRLARAGLKAVLQVHDELVYCVPIQHEAACRKAIAMAMTAPVDFMPRLPVAVEIFSGQSYGDCK